MPQHLDIQTAPAPSEQPENGTQKVPSATQLAAVVEAAYILEAVRK